MTHTASLALHPTAADNAERTAARSLRVNERQYLFPDVPDHLIPDGFVADMDDAFDLAAAGLQPCQFHPISTDHVARQVLLHCPSLAETPGGEEGVRAFVGGELLSLASSHGRLRTDEARVALSRLETARSPEWVLFDTL
ncbi:hypothetical protein D893_02250 [Thioalkalivibrio sp. ALE21]|uniref:hypothetical protein n=1 Tax=Thioalkalivibrio sp. ALE21 TaxID=1158175 RepID=UPI000D82CF10|nr:hypothetical protein [Thioalkalivibrio sp. ALE21]PYG00744.1 hypothetical protein D893_02250 [Thioalkalivibrio sp. ALE21]